MLNVSGYTTRYITGGNHAWVEVKAPAEINESGKDLWLAIDNGDLMNVVTAKVQAVLRRAYALQGTANIIEHGEMLLNLGDASLTIAGQKIELTKNEFKICQMFFESAGKFVTRDAIMTRLWESDEFIDDNTLTVNMTRLRKKLEQIGLKEVIQTKKGIGYMVAK